jgi:hypothetical protein
LAANAEIARMTIDAPMVFVRVFMAGDETFERSGLHYPDTFIGLPGAINSKPGSLCIDLDQLFANTPTSK